MTYYLRVFVAAAVLAAAAGCARKPPVEEAKAFLDAAEAKLLKLSEEAGRAAWVQSTYITDDTEVLAARANQRLIDAVVELVKEGSKRFDGIKLPGELARKMKLLKLSLTLATPADPKESEELTRIAAAMEGTYGKGRACPEGVKDPAKCLDINAITKRHGGEPRPRRAARRVARLARDRAADAQGLRALRGALQQGRQELGFADTGAMWRSKYDMPPDDFAEGTGPALGAGEAAVPFAARLRAQQLREKYGDGVVPATGPIPAHLLGNMWAQDWENIYPLVRPAERRPGLRPHRDPEGPQDRLSVKMVQLRRGLLHLARLRSAAADVLGALAVHQAARPRGGLPCQRLGRGQRRRPAPQDVHRDHRRGFHHHPPRAGPQLLPARLQPAAASCSATAPTTASTRPWATPSRSR